MSAAKAPAPGGSPSPSSSLSSASPSPSRTSSARAAKERLRLWIRMLRLTRAIEASLRESLRTEFGATLPRFDVMAALYRFPDGLILSELSRYLMVSNGNVTGIVNRLVGDGLVERTLRDGDRRTSVVRLTERGIERFESMASAHESWVNDIFAGLTPQDAERLSARLKQTGIYPEIHPRYPSEDRSVSPAPDFVSEGRPERDRTARRLGDSTAPVNGGRNA